MSKLRVCVIATLTLLLIASTTSATTFHGDAARTGNFTSHGPKTNEILWKTNLTGLIGSSPVVWQGKVYVVNWYGWGNWSPGLYCIDAETGRILWRNDNIIGASTPAIYNGTLIVGSLSGKLYAVNATTGEIIWEKTLEKNPEWWGIASSPLIYNGTIYVVTFSDGTLHALDFSGRELWNISTGNRVGTYSSPSAYGGIIFFAGNKTSNELYAVNESGKVLWTFKVDSMIVNTPSIGYGKVFFATKNRLYAVYINGTEAWNVSFSGTISTAALAYGKVYIGSAEGKLYCMNASSGGVEWVFEANGKIDSSPAVADGIVYFATNTPNGTVYAVYAENGTLLWKYTLVPPEGKYYNIMSSPFIYDGKLYIGADNGYVYAFGRNPVIWEGTVILSPGKVKVELKDGSVSEVDGLSALAALWMASKIGNFSVTIANTSWGLYVESIAGIYPEGLSGWMYWVNFPEENIPSISAADYILENGDTLIFYYGSYDPQTWEQSKPNESSYLVIIHVAVSNVVWEGEVTLYPEKVRITLKDGNETEINGLSALAALLKASEVGGFNVSILNTSWGLYVESIADIPSNGTFYWLYWVNYPEESFPSVGAADYVLSDGDEVIFYYGYYNSTTWQPSPPEKSPYVVKIKVKVPTKAYVTSLSVSNAFRGGFVNATVNVTALKNGWFVIVVSGTNANGDSIAGISMLKLNAGETVTVPVIIPIPQQIQTGKYELFAGVYELSDYPKEVAHIFGKAVCEVS